VTQPFLAEDARRWTDGELLQGDARREIGGVSIDSRALAAGELFVAIAGERFDGHDFLDAVVAAGASALVVARGRGAPAGAPAELPVIAVDDTTRALGALASGHRSLHRGPLVAITGSNGKTTTKEMCAAILGVAAPCLKNEGNLNNEFGLPLSLLRRDAAHRSVVVELGMNHRGEIARLAAIARADVGVVTNVGTAHIEHLGSREEIALEKGDLVAALPAEGTAVLNGDDALASAQAERTRARVLRFGRGSGCDVRAEDVRAGADGRYAFTLAAPGGRAEVAVTGLGETTVTNALAAAAAALAAGAPLADVPRGLAAYRPVPGRLVPAPLADGGLLIDDTYNANPQSMAVALRTLAGGEAPGRRIAVLGDMGELGEHGDAAHREVGELAARLGVDLLFALGEHADLVVGAAREAGMDAAALFASRDWEETAEAVHAVLSGADRVLVKGSRAVRMERIVERLRAAEGRSR